MGVWVVGRHACRTDPEQPSAEALHVGQSCVSAILALVQTLVMLIILWLLVEASRQVVLRPRRISADELEA